MKTNKDFWIGFAIGIGAVLAWGLLGLVAMFLVEVAKFMIPGIIVSWLGPISFLIALAIVFFKLKKKWLAGGMVAGAVAFIVSVFLLAPIFCRGQ